MEGFRIIGYDISGAQMKTTITRCNSYGPEKAKKMNCQQVRAK